MSSHSFTVYPLLKPQITYYSNHLAIWHGLPDIRHIKVKMADGLTF